jgi:uncharacterized protein (TIGR02266 family)
MLASVLRLITLSGRPAERCKANLRFTFTDAGITSQAFSRDLSLTGAFLKADPAPAAGSELTLRFRLPADRAEIVCTAIVRRVEHDTEQAPAGFGVEFQGFQPEDRDKLERFIRQQLS